MKTQILHLEEHDDLISTRDKLGWRQTGRILLVFPKSGRILRRQYDLVMLQRHTNQHGAQLALVTNDLLVRFNARLQGIPVFTSTEQAQKAPWRRRSRRFSLAEQQQNQESETAALPHHREPVKNNSLPRQLPGAVRILLFMIGITSILALAAFLLPGATIHFTPLVETQELTIDVQADPAVAEMRLSGEFPVASVPVIVEGRESIPTSSTTSVPQSFAKGEVTFTNLTESAVQIPAGAVVTSLEHPEQRYSTTRAGALSAGIGQQISLPVQALLPGGDGNAPALSINAVEGTLGLSAAVSNLEPVSGGTNVRVPAATVADREKVFTVLLERLTQDARAEFEQLNAPLSAREPADLQLSAQPHLVAVIEESYQPAADGPADQQSLTLRLEFEIQVIKGQSISQFAEAILDANLPPRAEPLRSSLEIEHLELPDSSTGFPVAWQMHVVRLVSVQPDEDKLIPLVLGKEPRQALEILRQAVPEHPAPVISLNPEWWPRLPFVRFRINIKTDLMIDSP